MIKNNQVGFTLIELLVTISIIGLLSTMAVVALGSAREKARDAKRVSDLKSLSNLIEMGRADLGDDAAIVDCDGQYAASTLCTGGELGTQTANFTDPAGVAPCEGFGGTPSIGACAYSISSANGSSDATYGDYQVCAYLENGSGAFGSGLLHIGTGGVLATGCQ